MSRYAPLFRPLAIKGLTIRNRILSTAHTSGAGEGGKPRERYQRYHEEKARGGVGLTMIGGSTAVAEDTPGADMLHLDASTDDIVPFYRELAARVHAHGAAVFSQIAHMGRRANWDNQHWLAPIAPSAVREAAHRSFPKAMEDTDFRRIRVAFGAAAGRVQAGGLDGVELSATHGHLIDQFWSLRSNRRTDRYGGSFENRLRFTLEILEDVRRAVGPDFIVGLRMSADELLDGGLTGEDCIRIAQVLTREGSVDYLSVLAGQAENLAAHARIFPGMGVRSAPFLQFASAIKANVSVPVFHAQRITDLATAARAVADGHVDMVGMTRAHLADPHIVQKTLDGREDDVRPCVGANYCIDRLYAGGQAYCLHNPATGREQTLPHVISKAVRRRRAVVVGAGPAGLEAARVLAERGHEVTLFEREEHTGGALNVAARVPWRSNLLAITRWLEHQVRKRKVDLRLGTEASAELVRSLRPDLVVVATGGQPAKDVCEGYEFAVTVWDVLLERAAVGRDVLLFDDNGAENALSCAQFLAERGARVEFMTADPIPGALLERTTRPAFLEPIYRGNVRITLDSRLRRLSSVAGHLVATVENEYTGVSEERAIDQAVIEYGTQPCASLYFELKPLSRNLGEWDLPALVRGGPQRVVRQADAAFDLFRVGNAVACRNVHAAILDSLRICKDA